LSKWPWKATLAVENAHGHEMPFGHENDNVKIVKTVKNVKMVKW